MSEQRRAQRMNLQQHAALKGIKAASPVVLGYFPIGMAFGVLAVQAGLNVWEVLFMSLMVYAGSSQFIAAGMLGAGASAGAIIATTFLVNSRHLLMSASLAPYVKKIPARWLNIIGFGITDETFAVAMNDVTREEKTAGYFLGLNLTAYASWAASTVVGAAVGNLIPDPQLFGLHFALPAMFIGLLVMQLRDRLSYVIALLAVGLSLFFKLLLPGNWNVILASVITATIGVIIESWKSKSSPSSSA